MSKKKILVVDDEVKIVEVLTAYLENNDYAVSVAYNGRDAWALFNQTSPALVLLDLMLPDLTGEELCKMIRRKSRTPIIMLTAKIDEENVLNGLELGADDYITKPFSPREVMARISAVLRRAESAELTEKAISYHNDYLIIDFKTHTVKVKGQMVSLTPTEFKLLATLAKSPDWAFSRDQLIEFALDSDFQGYDRTIDTYIKNIRQKIEADPKKPLFVRTIHGVGYRFGGE